MQEFEEGDRNFDSFAMVAECKRASGVLEEEKGVCESPLIADAFAAQDQTQKRKDPKTKEGRREVAPAVLQYF